MENYAPTTILSVHLGADSLADIPDLSRLRWDLFFQPAPVLAFIGALILSGLIWFIWNKRGEQEFIIGPKEFGATDEGLKLFYGWVPVILAIHVAVALLVNGMGGRLFFSNFQPKGTVSNWIGLTEIMIALSLFYGGLTRVSSVIMGFLWLLTVDLLGLRSMLESVQYLGFAGFFYLAGRGPYAIDRLLFPDLEPTVSYTSHALLFLRISVGLTFIIFGFTSKLANIPYAYALLENHPFLNFTGMSNEAFVLFAGALEILAGLLIVFGVFPRLTSLIALICINASLTIYDWNTLIDYLPIYGALAVLLVWEADNPNQRLMWVEGLRKKYDEPHSIDAL